MLDKIYGFFGIETKAARRKQLVCRLWYVHDMDLAEAFRSEFLDDIIRARRNVGTGVPAYQE